MAMLRCLNSGSSGNAYLIDACGKKLLLELGVKWNEVLKALNYKIDGVVGALVTHQHLDHAKSIPQALKYRIPVYSNDEVADKYKGVIALQTNKKYRVGQFIVQAVKVEHSAQNYAYILDTPDDVRVLFCTDAVRFPYKVRGVNVMMIEANYSEDIIVDNLCKGYDIRSKNQYHMEIGDTVECIKNNYSSDLNAIILLHLSDSQSCEALFIERVYKEIGLKPYIAKKNLNLSINRFEF